LASGQNKIVVIVDDDPGVRKALQGLLSVFGYAAIGFDSAEAFLGAAATTNADCLLVDVELRDISGVELGRRLLEASCKLPIIFMASTDDEIARSRATKQGCIAYLRKPFSSEVLIEAIGKATG
jgi:FixJ family two-component response regulator